MIEALFCPHCLGQGLLFEYERRLVLVFGSRKMGFMALEFLSKQLQELGHPLAVDDYNAAAAKIARSFLPEEGFLEGDPHQELLSSLVKTTHEIRMLEHHMLHHTGKLT